MTDRTEEILDYVHDRLDADARRDFEAELSRNAELRADLAVVRAVQGVTEAGASDDAVSDAGWTALSRAIDADRAKEPANDNRRFSLLQTAAIAAIAVVAAQILTAPLLMDGSDTAFAPASSGADAPTLQVAFAEDARFEQIAPLLREIGATFAGGPSAIGLVTLTFPDEATRTTAQETLVARVDLVVLVSEP